MLLIEHYNWRPTFVSSCVLQVNLNLTWTIQICIISLCYNYGSSNLSCTRLSIRENLYKLHIMYCTCRPSTAIQRNNDTSFKPYYYLVKLAKIHSATVILEWVSIIVHFYRILIDLFPFESQRQLKTPVQLFFTFDFLNL